MVEKLYAARQAGMRAMLLPKENAREVDVTLSGVQVVPVATVDQALRELRVHKLSTRRSQGRSQSTRRKTRRENHGMSISHLHRGSIDRIPPQISKPRWRCSARCSSIARSWRPSARSCAPADFYAHVHETIFAVLYDLFDRGEPLDKIAVAEALRNRDQLEKVGGLSYLSSLMDTVQTAASATYYAKIVREKATLRSLIHAGTQITQLGYDAEEDVDAALDQSEQMVYSIGERSMHGDFVAVNSLMKDAFEHIDRLFHARGDRTGVTSGFRDIDEHDDRVFSPATS